MNGPRRPFFVPALACLGFCAVLLAAASALPLPPAARPLLAVAALLVAAVFVLTLGFLRSLSGSLRRMSRTVSAEAWAVSVPGPCPESALPFLERAQLEAGSKLRLRAEEGEAESRRCLAVLNGMSEAVLAVDRALVLHLANRSARSLFALDGPLGFSLLMATRSTVLERAAAKALAEGRPFEAELRLRRAGGERAESLFRVRAAPLAPAADGSGAEGAVLALEDVTLLSRLEQIRKDFVANVSHELRTPIQLVKGFSETILDDPEFVGAPGEAKFRRFVEIIQRNAVNMENLTNDLLAIASLENRDGASDGVSAEIRRQPLAPLLEEAVLSVAPGAAKNGTRLKADCPEGLTAAVHASLLIQAMINLLDNAIKYSPKRSSVRAMAFKKDGEVVLEVRDKGIGISSEHIGRIFERFYRVDRAHSRESGGTGLGLAIVRHIALLHGGRAEVESHAGEGSVFRIALPDAPEPEAADGETADE